MYLAKVRQSDLDVARSGCMLGRTGCTSRSPMGNPMARRVATDLAKAAVLLTALLGMSACATKPPMVEEAAVAPLSGIVPGTRAVALDEAGRRWDVTILQSYFAASGRECLRVQIAATGTRPGRGNSLACASAGRWVLTRNLRADERTTAVLPASFTFNP
jgi:hypothetical protein